MSSLIDFIGETFDENFHKLTPAVFVSNVEAYAQPLINYFRNPSFEDIRTFKRVTSGSGAAASGMRAMQKLIRIQDESFSPKGLEEYIENERLVLVTDTTNLSNEIMVGLTDIVVGFLKQKYPNGEDWFLQGCPLSVKQQVIAKREEQPTSSLRESFNMPTHSKLIAQGYGSELQGKLKVGDWNWCDTMIEIRNAVSHVDRGRLIDPEWIPYMQHEVLPIVTNGKVSLDL